MAKHNIFISGDIVPFNFYGENEYSIKNLNDDLNELSVSENDELIVDINTYGGDTETGFAMYNQLLRFKNENKVSITTRVTGYCASIGSVILLAGDKRIGNQFNTPFVHNAWTFAMGDTNDMQKVAEDLEKTNNKIATLYAEVTNIDFETAKQLMNDADFIDAEKVLEYGFYTEIENKKQSLNKIFNSINNKNNKMSNLNEKITQIWNKLFQTDNKVLYTANNSKIDFYELSETEDVLIGAKARIDNDNADGEVVMSTGETFVFEKGTLVEIKEVETPDEIQNLKNQIADFENQLETLKATNNSLNAEIEKYKQFKNEVLNIKIEEPIAEPTPAPTTTITQNNVKQDRTFNFK